MLKKVYDLGKIKDSNLFFFLEKKSDLNKLSFLDFDKSIKKDISEKIEKKTNWLFQYFMWRDDFKNLYIYIFSDNKGKDINYLLWKEINNLPKKITVLTNNSQNVEILLNNVLLWRYKFEKYKSEKSEDEVLFFIDNSFEQLFDERVKTIENIILARDLWFTASSELYPETFSEIVKKTKFKNVKVKVFDFDEIKKEWLWLLEAVWKWSKRKPRMVILEKIVDKKLPTIWIVGKWVTFDTWWIQVKPGDFMYEMKWDMCWAWTTFCIMKELDEKKLNVNIIACLVLAENHISWRSFKPSDVFKSYSWKTVDIIHTDAEWRLVLADGMAYLSKNYKLDKLISVATLTWACMVALGFRYAWIMWNDKEFINKFLDYSETNFEKYNKLPFDDYFVEKTKSEIADLENLNVWVKAWSTMWAAFLVNFCLNNEKYTHIDIAWTALNSYEPYWYANKWMTWFWVDSISYILKSL